MTRGIAFSTKAGVAAYVDLEKLRQAESIRHVGRLREVLSNGLIEKSVHDLKRALGCSIVSTSLSKVSKTTRSSPRICSIRIAASMNSLISHAKRLEWKQYTRPRLTGLETAWQTARAADLTAQTAHVLAQRGFSKKTRDDLLRKLNCRWRRCFIEWSARD